MDGSCSQHIDENGTPGMFDTIHRLKLPGGSRFSFTQMQI